MPLKLTLLFAAAAVLASPLSAQPLPQTPAAQPKIDKPGIEAYLRHLYVWPSSIEMTISDPLPGPMDGFFEVKVRGAQGKASQEETIYVSKDGKKIIQGTVYDTTQNPYKADLDKLKTEYQPSFGTPGAPVVVVEFSDFQCPYCKAEAKTLRDNLLASYPKEVRLYYLDFPLESLHPWAKAASIAGRCIYHQNADAFWRYHDWIFEKQDDLNPDNLKEKILEFSKGKGVDNALLSSCIDGRVTEAEVVKAKAIGQSLDVNSTPTLFINGRRIAGAASWPDLKRVIDYEIEYQKTAKNAGDDCGCTVSLPMPGMPAGASSAAGSPLVVPK